MAPSEWTRSVRAVRDTPVADYSAPGVDTTRRVVYRPPITVSLSLRILLVSYFQRSLGHCGQLWQWSEWVHSVRTCIGIAMRRVTLQISPLAFLLPARKMQFSLLIIHIIPSRQIYVAIDNPSLVPSVSCLTSCSYLWNYVRAADNISHAENLPSNGCRCFSHLYKFRDRIQVTRVFRYCGERQG